MRIRLHDGDLPDSFDPGDSVAVDCETMGLRPGRDRLCLVQVSVGDGSADLVRVAHPVGDAPNLAAILANPDVVKIFHFARFDIAALLQSYGILTQPVYCTKIASIFARTYAAKHSLKDLIKELLEVEINKEQQQSDWGRDTLAPKQLEYAATDVLHLHRLRAALDVMLAREDRTGFVEQCFRFLPHRAAMDLAGWNDIDLFAHSSPSSS